MKTTKLLTFMHFLLSVLSLPLFICWTLFLYEKQIWKSVHIMLEHRLEMGGHDNRARCHIPRCPFCLLPQGPGLVSWSPWLLPLFLPLSPCGLASVLFFAFFPSSTSPSNACTESKMTWDIIRSVSFSSMHTSPGAAPCIQLDLLAWSLGMQHPLLCRNWHNHQYPRPMCTSQPPNTCNRGDM